MDDQGPSRRNPLVVFAVVALFVSAAGVVALAQGEEAEVFTGCVNQNSGNLRNVALGPEPLRPCNQEEVRVTWDRAGPAFEERIAALEERVAELEEPFGTLDLFVDCAAGETVGAALDQAGTHVGPLSITISGVCEEAVFVGRDDVSFQGIARSDGIRAEPTDPWVVALQARRASFTNMTLGGAQAGIAADLGSTFVASDITVRDTSQSGISVSSGSSAWVDSCTIADNGRFGVDATNEGVIVINNCDITGSGDGVFSGGVGSATIQVSNSYIAHNLTGLAINPGGNIRLVSSTVEENPQVGIAVNGGELVVSGEAGPTRIANNGLGIGLRIGATADFQSFDQTIIESNDFQGIFAAGGSAVNVQNTVVRDNGGDGIRVEDLSTVDNLEGLDVSNNGGWGINCAGPPAVAVLGGQGLFDPANIVFSGNALGDTNCS